MLFLSFSNITLQFIKHQQKLLSTGYQIHFQNSNNIFQDTLTISKIGPNNLLMAFQIEFRKWDRYREFTLSYNSNVHQKHKFRLNPITGQPVKVTSTKNNWSMTTPNAPLDLQKHGQEVLTMFKQISEKYYQDQLALDALEH